MIKKKITAETVRKFTRDLGPKKPTEKHIYHTVDYIDPAMDSALVSYIFKYKKEADRFVKAAGKHVLFFTQGTVEITGLPTHKISVFMPMRKTFG